jgi:apolipoprotein N-acyltransferase
MKELRLPFLCAFLTAAGLTLAGRFGWACGLAWVAPVPVLWFAFGPANPMRVLAAGLAAGALIGLGALAPYFRVMPLPLLAAALALSGIGFAVCVSAARIACRSVSPMAGALTFGALWTVWDFLSASGPDGALFSPAYSQAAVPILVQSAAFFGPWALTFLIGTVSALFALAFRLRTALYLLPAAFLFMTNLGLGALHMLEPQGSPQRVSLIDSDGLAEASAVDREDIALGAVLAYAAEIRLKAYGSDLVVLPERIAVIRPQWLGAAVSILKHAAASTGATIVAGFESRDGEEIRNIALTITPTGEVRDYVQGSGAAGAVAISHDANDFAALRTRMRAAPTGLLLVPAWDYRSDANAQTEMAITRAIESGFAIARNARDGELVLADSLGRIIARKDSGRDGFTVLTRLVPAGPAPGRTLYDRIGDSLVWLCGVLALSILVTGLIRMLIAATPARDLRKRKRVPPIPQPSWSGISLSIRSALPLRQGARE